MNINLITPIPIENTTSPADHQDIFIGDIDKIPTNICKSLIINQTLNHLTNEQQLQCKQYMIQIVLLFI